MGGGHRAAVAAQGVHQLEKAAGAGHGSGFLEISQMQYYQSCSGGPFVRPNDRSSHVSCISSEHAGSLLARGIQ
jgi:hypothetical protein